MLRVPKWPKLIWSPVLQHASQCRCSFCALNGQKFEKKKKEAIFQVAPRQRASKAEKQHVLHKINVLLKICKKITQRSPRTLSRRLELCDCVANDFNALAQFFLSDDQGWGQTDLVPVSWLG